MSFEIKEELKKYIHLEGNKRILVHSDILFGFKVKFENQEQYLKSHYLELQDVCGNINIIMPSFNYNFCKGTPFNVITDESQVGTLSEYFRKNEAKWRTEVPVFNFAGVGKLPHVNETERIDPFDESSLFGNLYKNKDLMMHYGSGFHTTTLIHYAERKSGKLIYRYDKEFEGEVITSQGKHKLTKLIYHVRPMGLSLEYDWKRLEQELIKEGILLKLKQGRTQIMIARVDKIVDFWVKKLDEDAFYLLDTDTRKEVEQKYKEFKRPFLITDFE